MNQAQVKVQRVGRFLSGMVMPNIGAFIAWGFITALFIGPGWLPNENLAQMVGPMLKALLPILIGYTGGKMVGGTRGAVVGSVATFGVMLGAGGAVNLVDATPMLSGAMIAGPLGGWVIKKIDDALEGKIPAGFEMLVNNFTSGLSGMFLAILGFLAIGPVIQAATNAVSAATQAIVDGGFLPLVSIVVEPAKILFLNNTLNWGIFAPLGVTEAAETGKSIFFLLETNPGPGLGILLACYIFGKGITKQSAPGAIIIHFLGGIHEIYFPYVLAKPMLVFAAIGGGMAGVFTNVILKAGLVAGPSPGSIFALLAMTPKGGFISTLLGVAVATAVSFLIGSVIMKRSKDVDDDQDLEAAKEKMVELKGKKSSVVKTAVKKMIVACDAGMGSSAMGATKLRNKVKAAGLDIVVENKAIENIPSDADIVFTHNKLTDRAMKAAPNAEHIPVDDFMNTSAYDKVVDRLSGGVKKK
ncbi:MAG: PTS mannitol transporter subunit IIBC [Firmicutes bacterium HGW-Firmicutes-7]|nr:MAG: PTS mannitol transporter subunit IIBC [Firmicutes bacterium HGW-Firmicutes-7]